MTELKENDEVEKLLLSRMQELRTADKVMETQAEMLDQLRGVRQQQDNMNSMMRQAEDNMRDVMDQLQLMSTGCVKSLSVASAAAASSPALTPVLRPVAPRSSNPSNKHIMMSYAQKEEANPEHVKALADYLRGKYGYDVWQDIEGSTICGKMSGSIDKKMAEAVEKSAFVIICVSKAYPISPNCEQEAIFARQREKDKKLKIVYVMMQSDFTTVSRPEHVEGWLGFYVADNLWYPLWDKFQVGSTGNGN